MEDSQTRPVPRTIRSIWPAVLLLAIGIGMLIWARGYDPVAARFPSIVAVLMIVLGILDVLSRTSLPFSQLIRTIGGAGFGNREMSHDPRAWDQWQLALWIAGAFAGMAILGILAATPLFCALFVRFRGGRSWLTALTVGAIVFIFQFGVFEFLLDYELYRGLFVAKGGVAAW